MQIEDYLYQKNLNKLFLGKKPNNMKEDEWVLFNRQVLGVILLTLAYNVVFNIVNEKTIIGLMTALSNIYEKPSVVNKVYLMLQLFNLKMSQGTGVTDYLNEFNLVTS